MKFDKVQDMIVKYCEKSEKSLQGGTDNLQMAIESSIIFKCF